MCSRKQFRQGCLAESQHLGSRVGRRAHAEDLKGRLEAALADSCFVREALLEQLSQWKYPVRADSLRHS